MSSRFSKFRPLYFHEFDPSPFCESAVSGRSTWACSEPTFNNVEITIDRNGLYLPNISKPSIEKKKKKKGTCGESYGVGCGHGIPWVPYSKIDNGSSIIDN